MEIRIVSGPEWLAKWDAYVTSEDKASHLMLSEWNQAFRSYGFVPEFGVLLDQDKICGGFAAVLAKAAFWRFYIVPYGPIASDGYAGELDALTNMVCERGLSHKACYCHVTFPVSGSINLHTYRNLPDLPTLKSAAEAHLFRYVYSSNGLNWVSLKDFENEEAIIDNFRPSVRRYVRSALRKGLEMRLLLTEDDIREGYALCLENADLNGYSLRSWNDFRETLLRMTTGGQAKFIGAFKDGVIKGAGLIITAGNYNTYILGGTVREKPDLLAGHFVHWSAIRLTYAAGMDGYNISLGGSKGVIEFKNSYATEQVEFTDSKFHWILRPHYFRIFVMMEKYLKPHKKRISALLSMIRK